MSVKIHIIFKKKKKKEEKGLRGLVQSLFDKQLNPKFLCTDREPYIPGRKLGIT